MATSDAPFEVDQVVLAVRDIAGTSRFYREVVGLEVLSDGGDEVVVGVAGRPLLVLSADPHASEPGPREPGLFHMAFLLPSREDLGAWLAHAADDEVSLTGAADHAVSEALYLSDPEGNGVEIYADRPREAWHRDGWSVGMTSDPLDLERLAAARKARWAGAPEGTVIGHVHLKVGDLGAADALWAETLGLAVTRRRAEAHFYAAGGYHHHIAANTWRSAGAAARPAGRLGLREVRYRADPPFLEAAGITATAAEPHRFEDASGLAHAIHPRES